MKKKFNCDVDCAECATKMEDAIKKIDGVEDVRVNFLTQKLSLTASDENFDAIFESAVKAAKRIEPDVVIRA